MVRAEWALLHSIVVFLMFQLTTGCNEPFSPKGPFEQKLVVYSVLSTQSDTQYVRAYYNYDPPGFDPLANAEDRSDTSAVVSIAGSGRTITFHDTVITPIDQSRLSKIHTFISRPFRPHPSSTYTLTIVSSRCGTATATARVPDKGGVTCQDVVKLVHPEMYPNGKIEVNLDLDPASKGFIFRFVIVVGLENDSTFGVETELPSTYYKNSSGQMVPQFGKLLRTTSTKMTMSVKVVSYVQLLDDNAARFGTKTYRKFARFYLIQLDEGLYDYYSTANGFADPYSIRMDQPDYSNIQNGLGVFGAFNTDTLSIDFSRPYQ